MANEDFTIKDLKNMPISTIKTELPALAKALGVEPAELLRLISGPSADLPSVPSNIADVVRGRRNPIANDCQCCGSDSF